MSGKTARIIRVVSRKYSKDVNEQKTFARNLRKNLTKGRISLYEIKCQL